LPSLYIPQPSRFQQVTADPSLCLTPDRPVAFHRGTESCLSTNVRPDPALDVTPEQVKCFPKPALGPSLHSTNLTNVHRHHNIMSTIHDNKQHSRPNDKSIFNTETLPINTADRYCGRGAKFKTNEGRYNPPKQHHSLKQARAARGKSVRTVVSTHRGGLSPKKKSDRISKDEELVTSGSNREKVQYPVKTGPSIGKNDLECVYSRPELNSALLIAKKMKELRLAEFDVKEAVQSTMEKCPEIRQAVSNRASAALNVPFNKALYVNNPPLEFSEEEVLELASRERLSRMRAARPLHKEKDPEPNIMDQFPADLVREVPIVRRSGGVPWTDHPQRAPLDAVFSVHRYGLRWQNG